MDRVLFHHGGDEVSEVSAAATTHDVLVVYYLTTPAKFCIRRLRLNSWQLTHMFQTLHSSGRGAAVLSSMKVS